MPEHDNARQVPAGGLVTVAIRNLEGELLRLRSGEITNDEFRPSRTSLGVYGQRQPEEYMVRVRVPCGSLTSEQLRCLALVAREYGNNAAHVTTRQNVQLHWLKLDKVPEVLWRLARAGLTTLQSGGNSVRTVAACPMAGACPREPFDVTPYAQAVDGHYLGDDAVMHLPRKFKASFSGCPADCAYTSIQDFGAVAVARQENGTERRGFRVLLGGGLGVYPRLAEPLEDFVPEEDLLPTCEAVLRLFNRLGDRKNKQKARLKFVLQRLGLEEFRRLVQEEREALRAEAKLLSDTFPPDAGVPLAKPHPSEKAEGPADPGYVRWRRWNVTAQRQQGYSTAFVPLSLGDITSEQMEAVANLADLYAEGALRTSQQQDIVLRHVPNSALPEVYRGLRNASLTDIRAAGVADVTSCPGTSACSLSLTASKGLARQLVERLRDERYQEDPALAGLRIKVSGCPDSCGQHHLADIGLQGCALHASGRLYPAFQLFIGGEVTEERTRFAQTVLKLPARRVPEAVARLLAFYRSQRQPEERFSAFVDRAGLDQFRQLLADLTHVTPPSQDMRNFIDWDSTTMYILQRGEGECAV